jgi:CBS domain-containing protein
MVRAPDGLTAGAAYGQCMSALRPPTTSSLDTATVAEAMHRGVITCAPESDIATVAATMAANVVHAVVLLDQDRGSALLVTDLDVVRAALRDAAGVTAAELAREPLATVVSGAPLTQAISLMARREDAHILVSEPGAGWPAGMLSSLDVMAALAGRDPALLRVLRPGPARPLVSATSLGATTVGAVMHPGVVTCLPDESLERVAGTMADLRIHCVAVVGAARRNGGGDEHFVWGLLSDMDVLHAVNRAGPDVTAGELAVTSPLALTKDAGLERAASLMVEHDATHVVVVDRAGTPAGVVSTLDVLRILAAS